MLHHDVYNIYWFYGFPSPCLGEALLILVKGFYYERLTLANAVPSAKI